MACRQDTCEKITELEVENDSSDSADEVNEEPDASTLAGLGATALTNLPLDMERMMHRIGQLEMEFMVLNREKCDDKKLIMMLNQTLTEKEREIESLKIQVAKLQVQFDELQKQGHLSPNGQPSEFDLDLLLVGKTGHGKSSTANSIFDENIFDCSGSPTSMTAEVGAFQKEMNGRKVFVVDTPGLCDTKQVELTRMKTVDAKALQQLHDEAERNFSVALSLTRKGFHAILLVLKYGTTMTKEEMEAIEEMKFLLGENFIRNHGVLLMTNGEGFDDDTQGKKSFEEWCKEQKGFMETVLKECQYRCVLFRNHALDKEVKKQQRINLIKMVDTMTGSQRYTGGVFKQITEYWETGTQEEKHSRDTYLNSSAIYFRLVNLVRKTKRFDQKVVSEMKSNIEELKKVLNNVDTHTKEKLCEQIEKAENEINQLEEAIKSSKNGYVVDHPAIEAFVSITHGIPTILAAPFYVVAGVISAVIIGIFKGIWEGRKLAKRCTIQ